MEIALILAAFYAGIFIGFLMAAIVVVALWNRLREGN